MSENIGPLEAIELIQKVPLPIDMKENWKKRFQFIYDMMEVMPVGDDPLDEAPRLSFGITITDSCDMLLIVAIDENTDGYLICNKILEWPAHEFDLTRRLDWGEIAPEGIRERCWRPHPDEGRVDFFVFELEDCGDHEEWLKAFKSHSDVTPYTVGMAINYVLNVAPGTGEVHCWVLQPAEVEAFVDQIRKDHRGAA